ADSTRDGATSPAVRQALRRPRRSGAASSRSEPSEASLSSRFAHDKTQHPAGLLACFEQLASGGLAKMLKILGGTRVGREHFENRAGGKWLECPPRFQHRQRAQQPCGIEGRVHCQIAKLRHLSALCWKRGSARKNNCNKLPDRQQRVTAGAS